MEAATKTTRSPHVLDLTALDTQFAAAAAIGDDEIEDFSQPLKPTTATKKTKPAKAASEAKKPRKRKKAAAADEDDEESNHNANSAPPVISLLEVELEGDAELEEEYADPADMRYELFMLKEDLKKQKYLPSTKEMAAQLGIRYVAGVDPGTVNAAFCVFDIQESAIVYWRVFNLVEMVRACEQSTNMCLTDVKCDNAQKYRLETIMYAIRWWCSLATCPLHRADLVLIESQDFMRKFSAIEAAWYTALCGQKLAVDVHTERMHHALRAPKTYSVSATSVKKHFGYRFFEREDTPTENNNNSSSSSAASNKRKRAHGVGDVHRGDGDGGAPPNSKQYRANKNGARDLCNLLTDNARARDAFTSAALAGKWMHELQVEQTLDRLGGSKTDDLADALCMALYAADCLVPSFYKRTYGPTVRACKKRYVLNQTPGLLSARERHLMRKDEARADAIAEAHHQSLFAYARTQARCGSAKLQTLRSSLSRT